MAEGDRIWTKVIDIAWTKRKYFLSRKYVNQETGADLDEGQIQLEKEKAKAQEQRAARAAQVVAMRGRALCICLGVRACARDCDAWQSKVHKHSRTGCEPDGVETRTLLHKHARTRAHALTLLQAPVCVQLMEQVVLGVPGAEAGAYSPSKSPSKKGPRDSAETGKQGAKAKREQGDRKDRSSLGAGGAGGAVGGVGGGGGGGRGDRKDRASLSANEASTYKEGKEVKEVKDAKEGKETTEKAGKASKETKAEKDRGAGGAGGGAGRGAAAGTGERGLQPAASRDDDKVSEKACAAMVAALTAPNSDQNAVRVAAALISKTAKLLKTWSAEAERKAAAEAARARAVAVAAGGDARKGGGKVPLVVPQGRHTQLAAALRQAKLGEGLVAAMKKAEETKAGTRTLVVLAEAVRDVAAADKTLRELELGEVGTTELLSDLLVANRHGRQVLLAVMQALRNLAFDCEANRNKAGLAGACKGLTAVLVSKGCTTPLRTPSASSGSKAQGDDAGAGVEGAVAAEEGKGSEDKAIAAAAQGVRDLCRDCPANRERFLEAGACEALGSLLSEIESRIPAAPAGVEGGSEEGQGKEEWRDKEGKVVSSDDGASVSYNGNEVRRALLSATRYLAFDSPACRMRLAQGGVLEQLASIIRRGAPKKMGTGWMVLLAAVQAVAYLSYGEDANRKRLEELGVVKDLKQLSRVAMPKQVRLQMEKALRMVTLHGEASAAGNSKRPTKECVSTSSPGGTAQAPAAPDGGAGPVLSSNP